jgi:uncharacterized membrane protein YbjE (DUF340 family)
MDELFVLIKLEQLTVHNHLIININNMFLPIFILLIGATIGFLIRKREKLISLSNKLQIYVIGVMLFCLGVSIGNNPLVMSKLSEIGIKSLLLAILVVLFSAILAFIFYKFEKRKKQ